MIIRLFKVTLFVSFFLHQVITSIISGPYRMDLLLKKGRLWIRNHRYITPFNRFTKTLDTILDMAPIRLIGLNSCNKLGSRHLGTKAINETPHLWSKEAELRKKFSKLPKFTSNNCQSYFYKFEIQYVWTRGLIFPTLPHRRLDFQIGKRFLQTLRLLSS